MKAKINQTLWLYRIGFVVLGAVAGYYYWATIGCSSGTCPITSKWLNTTLYGGVLGYLVGDILKDFFIKTKKENNEQLPEDNK